MSKMSLTSTDETLVGRKTPLSVDPIHAVNGSSMIGPFPDGTKTVLLGMGCFWGAERRLWQQPGVITTAAGYAGGVTPNPTYEEVCSGLTNHTEVVFVAFDTRMTSLEALLRVFWESHDPTQGMRQGNDRGTQYRSAIFVRSPEDLTTARSSAKSYQEQLSAAGFPAITTEIRELDEFFLAETYHQQYLHKNPMGYCGLAGTGVSCPIGLFESAQ